MTASRAGALFVLAGPAGVGKSTLRNGLLTRLDRLAFSVSCTTRPRRPSERDGVDYHFVARERFERLIAAGAFLEWAEVHGRYLYGTLLSEVWTHTEGGRDVLLEIDVQGAAQIRDRAAALPADVHFVFILPPSWETLRQRLSKRRTEDPEQVERRLQSARAELVEAPRFDLLVVNHDVEQALDQLIRFIKAARASS